MSRPSAKILKLSPGRKSVASDRNKESAETAASPTKATDDGEELIVSLLCRLFRIDRTTCAATSARLLLVTLAAKWISTKYLSAVMPFLPHVSRLMGRSIAGGKNSKNHN